MQSRHRVFVLAVVGGALLAALLGLAACGATAEPQIAAPAPPRVVEREAAAETGVEQVEAAAPTAAPAPTIAPAPPAEGSRSGLALPVSQRVGRMIIKDAELHLRVDDTDRAIESVTTLAADYGGYIISSQTWYDDNYKVATIRLGVPVEQFETILNRLRNLALTVEREEASGEDVTDQYVDLQSRLTNLEATAARVRQFLEQANTVEEALRVNAQLSDLERQIAEIKGRMQYLQDRSAYSTITVHLAPERPTPTPTPTATPTPTPTPIAWRPGQTVQQAGRALTAILRFVGDAAIWLGIVLLPMLVPVALVVGVVFWVRRRRRAKAAKGE